MNTAQTQINLDLDYSSNIEIADGVYWVGFEEAKSRLHCNSYLIVDEDEAVLIDGGSRNDFSTVMLKIMRTGINPGNIIRLLYHHYDPDLCGNLPHMEALIDNEKLKILSHFENNIFLDCYSTRTEKQCIEEQGYHFEFSSGRRLEFIHTPYAHSLGSFVTYDTKTKVLFSSDLFGSYDINETKWEMYTMIDEACADCEPEDVCPATGAVCQVFGILDYHKRVMTSTNALRYALEEISKLDISLVAPQHGSLLHTPESREVVLERLRTLSGIGIDSYVGGAG